MWSSLARRIRVAQPLPKLLPTLVRPSMSINQKLAAPHVLGKREIGSQVLDPSKTVPTNTEGTPCIDSYMKDYTEKYEAFKQVAKYVEDVCNSELRSSAILGTVTSRAKDPERLWAKLKTMNTDGKDFDNTTTLENNIMDLIGVRVTLYFPSQAQEVVNRFQTLFSGVKLDVDTKSITDVKKGEESLTLANLLGYLEQDKAFLSMNSATTKIPEVKNYVSKYGGYRAVHLRLELEGDDLGTNLQTALEKRRLKVEIQIQSLLMHAWSEVNHDLAYKNLSGVVSDTEKHLLDLLNGIGKMGENVLRHLKGALDGRLEAKAPKNEFTSVLKLADFIRTKLKTPLESKQSLMLGDVKDLRDLLVHIGKNDRTFMEKELADFKHEDNTSPVVNGIFTKLLVGNKLEEILSSNQPFLLRQHNAPLIDQIEVLDKKSTGVFNTTFSEKMVPNAKLAQKVINDKKLITYEILASVLDLTLRPYIQSTPPSNEIVEVTKPFKDLQKFLYQNSQPIIPRLAYTVNTEELRKEETRKKIDNIVKLLSGDQYANMTPLQYYLRLARLRAWPIYADRVGKLTF